LVRVKSHFRLFWRKIGKTTVTPLELMGEFIYLFWFIVLIFLLFFVSNLKLLIFLFVSFAFAFSPVWKFEKLCWDLKIFRFLIKQRKIIWQSITEVDKIPCTSSSVNNFESLIAKFWIYWTTNIPGTLLLVLWGHSHNPTISTRLDG